MTEFAFVMDDPEAVQILAAYFPPADNVADTDRLRWAIEAHRKLHPEEDQARAEEEVKRLLETEEAEHDLLAAYWGVVRLHMAALHRATRVIQTSCTSTFDTNTSQELWFYITLALSSCAAISRMFEASHNKAPKTSPDRLLRNRRAALLRSAAGRRDTSAPYLEHIRLARNAVEHFEEYFDVWLHRAISEKRKIWDLQIVTEAEVEASGQYFVRWFDDEKKVIHVFDWAIPLSDLDNVFINLTFVNTSIDLRGRYHPQLSFGLYG